MKVGGDRIKARTISLAAAGLCLLFLLAGLARTILSPDTEIAYENRPAKRMPPFSLADFLSGDFQAGFEDALADQLPEAIRMKKLYNIYDTALALPAVHALGQNGVYVGFRNICFFEDMLTVRPLTLSEKGPAYTRSAEIINAWAGAASDVDFYVYYIEADRDLNLETGEKSGFFDRLAEVLTLPEDHVGRLRVDGFDDYHRLFLKTDHHWNAEGSYRGYLDICALLRIEPLPLLDRYTVPACYRGTRAAGVEGVPAEDFAVNLFDYPAMRVTIPVGELPDYGMQELFVGGELESVSYGLVFGVDCGELLLDTGRPGKNLLVMGDSYDNAIVKPLAASFSKTWCVDLRSYAGELGQCFDMASYLREKDIDLVLIVGGVDYFGGTLPSVEGGL